MGKNDGTITDLDLQLKNYMLLPNMSILCTHNTYLIQNNPKLIFGRIIQKNLRWS